MLEHPEYGYRGVTEELHRKGIPVNPLLQDFHLSLKRTARRPKPNPWLQAKAKAVLQAQVGRLPKALVLHDQGGPFLSHDWVGTLLLRDGQRLSYSPMGAKGNPVVESFFARFKGEGQDRFLEAESLGELKGVVEERLRYHHEGRLRSGLGYRTPKEVMSQRLS